MEYTLPKEIQSADLGLINDHLIPILRTISQNPVTNVTGGSGIGKTTQLPIKIAENGNRIMVVTSKKGVAESLSGYAKKQTDMRVGNSIDGSEPIKFVDRYSLKEYLYDTVRKGDCFDLEFADILMIDEADVQSYDDYMIGSIWKYCAAKKAKVPRLLLVSTGPVVDDLYDIKTYSIPNNRSIEYRYINNNSNLADLVYDVVKSSDDADILIFTGNNTLVGFTVEQLNRMEIPNVNIYLAHEGISKEEIDRIYQPTDARKIIVTDKTGETTFNTGNIKIVIDTMIDYYNADSKTGGRRYKKVFISQQQARIRCSRINGNGICYRLISQERYKRLPIVTTPEIYRFPIDFIMMELIEKDLDPYEILSSFTREELDYSYSLMVRMGIIDPTGKISDIGKFAQKLPYGIRQSTALYYWIQNDYPAYPAIVLLSMIDIFDRSYYLYPLKQEDQSQALYNMLTIDHRSKYFEPFAGISDIHTFGYIWNTMMDDTEGNHNQVKEWCDDNYINYDNILEVILLNDMITEVLDVKEKGYFDTDSTISLLGPILSNIYQDRKLDLEKNNVSRVRYVDNNHNYYKIDTIHALNTIELDSPPVIYGLIISVIKSEYGSDFRTIPVSLVLSDSN